MEREEKEKVKKREKKLEDEETMQQATWVKYTFPIKHQVSHTHNHKHPHTDTLTQTPTHTLKGCYTCTDTYTLFIWPLFTDRAWALLSRSATTLFMTGAVHHHP
jgi:hypothetical protein